jgi:hypothetical protein
MKRTVKPGGTGIEWDTSASGLIDDGNLLEDNINTANKSIGILIDVSNAVGLDVNVEKTKRLLVPRYQNYVTIGT